MSFITKCVLSVNNIIRKLGLYFYYSRKDIYIKKDNPVVNIVDLIMFIT